MLPISVIRERCLTRARGVFVPCILLLSGCVDNWGAEWVISGYTVETNSSVGGSMVPARASVGHGGRISFRVTVDEGYRVTRITGCNGTLSGTTYTTGPVTRRCSVRATFQIQHHEISTIAGAGGGVAPSAISVPHGETASFTITPEDGYGIDSVSGCNGSLSGRTYTTGPLTQECSVHATFRIQHHEISTIAGAGGSVAPSAISVPHGETVSFTVTAEDGYRIDSVSGCNGTLSGTTYITGPVYKGCGISASFIPESHTVTAAAGIGGTISPASVSVGHGDTASFVITAYEGYRIGAITGCNGSLSGGIYTTGAITTECSVNAAFVRNPPATAATPTLTPVAIKGFLFNWTDLPDATYYRLLEDPDGISGYTAAGSDIPAGLQQATLEVPLHLRAASRYILQSCNEGGCTSSPALPVSGTLAESIGYFKAGNAGATDQFGYAIALSGNGAVLVVGAPAEDGNGTGVNSSDNNLATNSRAVYIFAKGENGWVQQAYIKAGNTSAGDRFGFSVDLNHDGDLLAIGAYREDSGATDSGAVYLFARSGGGWTQQAYIKAGNSGSGDNFGYTVALSGDGGTLAVGAPGEDSTASGIDGDGNDDSAPDSGAVYLFRNSNGVWTQQAYIKAGNSGAGDRFGSAIDLSRDGSTLAAGAPEEDGNATVINGDGNNNSRSNSGAIYLFIRDHNGWSQQAYIKAGNAGAGDRLGHAVALNGSGDTLAAGAWGENSAARRVDGNGSDNSAADAGAVYLFFRSAEWQPQAYLKAENIDAGDRFGWSVSLSDAGDTLAVGARLEDGSTTGVDGDATDNSASGAGAAYLFIRSNGIWGQKSYIKASNSGAGDQFGRAVALSGNADTLAVAGYREDSNATGINGDAFNDSRTNSGAVYLY